MSTNIHLQIKIVKSLVKTRTLNAGTSELILKRNHLKYLTIHSPLLSLYQKKNILKLSTLESTTFNETIRCASKWVHFNIKNAKLISSV